MYPGKDLRVVTAVRLAATFPFVTLLPGPTRRRLNDYHMIDGGYYDNYGISSLLAWLDQGLADLQDACERGRDSKEKEACENSRLPQILVLQIRPFPADEDARQPRKRGGPSSSTPRSRDSFRAQHRATSSRSRSTGFVCQTLGIGCADRPSKNPFRNLRIWRIHWARERDKAINPPLSWAMSPSQIQAVKEDWEERVNHADPTRRRSQR